MRARTPASFPLSKELNDSKTSKKCKKCQKCNKLFWWRMLSGSESVTRGCWGRGLSNLYPCVFRPCHCIKIRLSAVLVFFFLRFFSHRPLEPLQTDFVKRTFHSTKTGEQSTRAQLISFGDETPDIIGVTRILGSLLFYLFCKVLNSFH